MSEAMNEAVRALSAEEAVELIGTHIEAFADGGPNRKAEDIELGRKAGLKGEMISDLWDDAEKQVQANIELQVLRSTEPVLPADQRTNPEAANLQAAITQYTDNRMDAKYLGNKLNTDKGKIAGGLRLCSDYDTHTKVNHWYVETLGEGR